VPSQYLTKKYVRIDQKYFPYVIDGLERVVTSGTATVAYVPGLDIVGKTGTAQNPHGKDHSVFFGFAPKNNPKIAIAVFVENAGFGAQWAAPIASLMMEKYINGQISPERKYLEEKMMTGSLLEQP
jgi:penicillin-binding protein 2